MDDFKAALAEVLKTEGGYSNHPKDPGGATMKGVTQRVYDDYRRRKSLPTRDVRNISPGEIEDIYRASYWDLARCDDLPAGVSYVVFDGAVNSGVKQSVKWLQRALGVRDDGVIGPTTIDAARSRQDVSGLIDIMCYERLKFLKALKTWKTFGRGWSARVEHVRITAKSWAGHTSSPAAEFVGKAYEQDIEKAPSAAPGDAAASAGVTGTLVTQALDQLTPFSNIEMVAKIVAVLTVVSVALAIGGILYGVYARRQKAKVKEAVGS